jgi:hypothetical protein
MSPTVPVRIALPKKSRKRSKGRCSVVRRPVLAERLELQQITRPRVVDFDVIVHDSQSTPSNLPTLTRPELAQ